MIWILWVVLVSARMAPQGKGDDMIRGMRIYLACIWAVNLAAAGLIIYAYAQEKHHDPPICIARDRPPVDLRRLCTDGHRAEDLARGALARRQQVSRYAATPDAK